MVFASTVYIGAYFERTGDVTTSYYYAGGTRVAKRSGGVVTYLHGDHLGSASLATNSSGVVVANSSTRYYPYGATRSGGTGLPTDYRFTGQLLDASSGLYHMGARWYDPALGRWLSADTIIPDPSDPQSLNRYSWVLANPLLLVDPSGHAQVCNAAGTTCADDETQAPPPPALILWWPYRGDKASGTYVGAGQEFGAPRFDDKGRPYSHEGMDIVTRPNANFAVRAPVSGRVTAGNNSISGDFASITGIRGHPDTTVALKHMEVWAKGDVSAGQVVGEANYPQGNATASVLHLELRVDGKARDSSLYLALPAGACRDCTVSGARWLVYVPPREYLPLLTVGRSLEQ
jgi:RHS repeat-associated protein